MDWFHLEKILSTCSLPEKEISNITNRLIEIENTENEFELMEIELIIEKIEANQIDPVLNALNYSQADILRRLRKI